jgi:hypothetical protein
LVLLLCASTEVGAFWQRFDASPPMGIGCVCFCQRERLRIMKSRGQNMLGLFSWAGVFAAVGLGVMTARARADVAFLLTDPNPHGLAVSATALFQTVSGGFQVTLNNTNNVMTDSAQAISEFQFALGAGMGGATLAEISGTTTNFTGSPLITTGVDVTSDFGASVHWLFAGTGIPTGTLIDVSDDGAHLTGPMQQPTHMIVAAGVNVGSLTSSLTGDHLPSFIGPVVFRFTDPTVPADLTINNITDVQFAFGTGPEIKLESYTTTTHTTPAPLPTPLPKSVWAGLGLLGLVAIRRRKAVGRQL